MAIRIDLGRAVLQKALTQAITSLQRQEKKEFNPGIRELLQKDIAEITHAYNSMTDVK